MPADLLLGAIADEHPGAIELAGMLASQGARTVQVLGRQPDALLEELADRYQAIVVALRSRSVPAVAAQSMSAEVLRQLRTVGARQIFFKYGSTFDSTAEGNIGPVTDALMAGLGTSITVAVPSVPARGRTQYLGHLFVNGELLSESPLREHPVNPMTESNLLRHLQAQTSRRVGLIPFSDVRGGPGVVRRTLAALERQGVEIALVDALADEDLDVVARAVVDLPLVTGASGLGLKLALVWRDRGWLRGTPLGRLAPAPQPGVLLLAGSCSDATLEQIRLFEASGRPSLRIDVARLLAGDGADEIDRLSAAIDRALAANASVLVTSSMPVSDRAALLAEAESRGLSSDAARYAIEEATAQLAVRATARGVGKLVVAGGETSSAVVEALGVAALEIGTEVEPGAPRCRTVVGRPLDLLFKAGDAGSPQFFVNAVRALRPEDRARF